MTGCGIATWACTATTSSLSRSSTVGVVFGIGLEDLELEFGPQQLDLAATRYTYALDLDLGLRFELGLALEFAHAERLVLGLLGLTSSSTTVPAR